MGLAETLFGQWLRHAHRRQEAGEIPFERPRASNVRYEQRPIILVAHISSIRFDDVNRDAIRAMLGDADRISTDENQ